MSVIANGYRKIDTVKPAALRPCGGRGLRHFRIPSQDLARDAVIRGQYINDSARPNDPHMQMASRAA